MAPDTRLRASFQENFFNETDIVKMIVILSFSAISLISAAIGLESGVYSLFPLLCCVPILFAVLWFPGSALQVTTFLVVGFALIHIRYMTLGVMVDPIISGMYVIAFFRLGQNTPQVLY